jgi:hypothetical protein
MSYIPGKDLDVELAQTGRMAVEQALGIILPLAGALAYLHSQTPPVLHRDIKPANIRIQDDGRPVLVDFGLVKAYDPLLRTTRGAQAATPGYSPPEQYGQGGRTDPRSDIYALGATLYTLLTSETPPESVERLVIDTLRPIDDIRGDVPEPVRYAVKRAMALNPADRFTTVGEFTEALSGAAPQPQTIPPPRPQTAPAPTPEKTGMQGVAARLKEIGLLALLFLLCLGISIPLVVWANLRLQGTGQVTQTAPAAFASPAFATQTEIAAPATPGASATPSPTHTVTLSPSPSSTATVTPTRALNDPPSLAPGDLRLFFEARGVEVLGPYDGSFRGTGATRYGVDARATNLEVKNFIARVEFIHPKVESSGVSYGLSFRRFGFEDYWLELRPEATWRLVRRSGDVGGEEVAAGSLPVFNLREFDLNTLWLACVDKKGWLVVNDMFIAELDLSGLTITGDVLVGGFGEQTITYQNLKVWALP